MVGHAQHTAVVTGAGLRIGRAVAIGLADNGWTVVVHYNRSGKDAKATVDDIVRRGGHAVAMRADLASEAQTEKLIPRVAKEVGPATLLVNNASIFEYDSALTVTRESWRRHMDVNLWAPFSLTQAFARQVPDGREGNVINIIDQRVWNLTPHFTSYTVSKAGLWTLTRTLAQALAPKVRVNAVGPGPTLPSPRQTQEHFEAQVDSMPLGRAVSPDEIGKAIQFILEAPSMTGQMIALDAGQHLGYAHPANPDAPEE